ncbi:MAG: DUF2884 family protein [Gammaproteobacteria bacterium]|nr:DUF2884 family protein [Gammaproteobacteria bacterium]
MNRINLLPAIAAIMLGLGSLSATAGTTNTDSWSYEHNSINLDHGDAVIHGNNGTAARIMPDGALYIAGKPQIVTSAQRQQLRRYVATVEDMQAKGLALAGEAGDFAAGIVGDVMAGLFSGDSDQIDKQAHRRAHDFAQKALPICEDAKTLKQIQETLVASLPAFKPYAVIEGHDVNDCERGINYEAASSL